MVVLEESIEVANVLVKLQVSEKAIVELKKRRTGREGGGKEEHEGKLDVTEVDTEGTSTPPKDHEVYVEKRTENKARGCASRES